MDEPEVGELWTNDTDDAIVKVVMLSECVGELSDQHATIVIVQNHNRTTNAWDFEDFTSEHTYRSKAHEE